MGQGTIWVAFKEVPRRLHSPWNTPPINQQAVQLFEGAEPKLEKVGHRRSIRKRACNRNAWGSEKRNLASPCRDVKLFLPYSAVPSWSSFGGIEAKSDHGRLPSQAT
jgi:hypothetical protein